MPTLDQLDLIIREYHVINILLFIIGWMIYDLYKLNKNSKLSEKQLDIVKYNIQKANKLVNKKQSEYKSIDRLKKDLNSALKTIRSKSSTINEQKHSIEILESENKFLKNKIDILTLELMKKQSYDNVEKPKFFQESTYPFATFTNQNNEGSNS